MKQKLNAKDFILIGVLTALMWIICMIISTIMSVAGPVTNVFYPSVVAIPNGIVMMLLLAKVPKKRCVHYLLRNPSHPVPAGGRFLVYPHRFGDRRRDLRFPGHGPEGNHHEVHDRGLRPVQRHFCLQRHLPHQVPPERLCGSHGEEQHCPEYIDGMLNITSVPMLVVIVAAGLVGGLIGAVIGQKALKKHFIKAGLVSVK